MTNGKTAGMDSSDPGSSWMKTMNTVQERLINNAWGLLDPHEAWNLWLETTLNTWREVINMGYDPLGLMASWVKMMEKLQERIQAGQPLAIGPFEMFEAWYDAMSIPWSRAVEENIASERFLAFAKPGLENYSHLIGTFRRASEAYFKTLQLPTHSDIARMAELIVGLEEKVDNIEETIEQAKEQQSKQDAATMASIADVEQYLNQIQTRIENILTLLEKGDVRIGKGTKTSKGGKRKQDENHQDV